MAKHNENKTKCIYMMRTSDHKQICCMTIPEGPKESNAETTESHGRRREATGGENIFANGCPKKLTLPSMLLNTRTGWLDAHN